MNKILRDALGLHETIIESIDIEENTVIVKVRPYARQQHRCSECGRRCPTYDRAKSARRWRAMDLGSAKCFLEYRMERISCPEHAIISCKVPWARNGSWFTYDFEDQVAWLSIHACRSVVSNLMRIDWKSVGAICGRVACDLESSREPPFDDLKRIGIDETSYKKGHKYLTIIVDHDKSRVVWAAKGYGKDQLDAFFCKLTPEQRGSIEVVTADGARWIADRVAKWCPDAERVMDPFHVVSWANDALDGVRKRAWKEAYAIARCAPRRGRGRPAKGEIANPEKKTAAAIKNTRFALLKSPEKLTLNQTVSLEMVAKSEPKIWRGYLLKERLRDVFGSADEKIAQMSLES